MKVSALILSDNEIFARMLSHELSYMRIESTLIGDLELISDAERFDIILADLDFAGDGYISALIGERGALELSSKHNNDGKALVIGWSSVETPEYYSDFSVLSAFLHRPFLMSDLRYIIAGYFSVTEHTPDAPSSISDDNGYLSYLSRLRRIEEQVKDKIVIVPRVYTNKPRTTGQGYKGMLHQPVPNEKPDMYKGIVAIRELHLAALRDYDFSCADEMLYPENYRYLSDLLSYVAIGARSYQQRGLTGRT